MAKKRSMYSGLEKRLKERIDLDAIEAPESETAETEAPEASSEARSTTREPAREPARKAEPPRPIPPKRPEPVRRRISSHRDPEAYSTRTRTGKVKVNLSISVELDEALVLVFAERKAEAREAGDDLRELTKAGIVEEILRRDAEVATALRDLAGE